MIFVIGMLIFKARFSKLIPNKEESEVVLVQVLCEIYLMMNPFMPHLTEELWHGLKAHMLNYFL